VKRLKPVRQNKPRRTLTALASLAANWRQPESAQFFLRQGGFFSRRMRGGEQFGEKRGHHDLAENIP
jgi:hypothetical protein